MTENETSAKSAIAIPLLEQTSEQLAAKEKALRMVLKELGSVLVAYSGGVDSSYLAHLATRELGRERALCVTGNSASVAVHQLDQAKEVAALFGLKHEIIATEEVENPQYRANAGDRCYHCKSELYEKLRPLADERGLAALVDGSTLDDVGDYRPGMSASRQMGVRSPFIEAGINKADVRQLSKEAGLPTWDKPASPCLSSRIAYGTTVTIERLRTVDRGEELMRSMGFREFRVRHHDQLVRLEISPAELDRVLSRKVFEELARQFKALGFRYVTLDVEGYRTGAMNEVLELPREHS